jgi:hypothetical protein
LPKSQYSSAKEKTSNENSLYFQNIESLKRRSTTSELVSEKIMSTVKGYPFQLFSAYLCSWQGWLDEDRTLLSVSKNDILGDYRK